VRTHPAQAPIDLRLVLDFLLFDANNPRSLTYQLDRLKAHSKNLPGGQTRHALTEYERVVGEANALLKSKSSDIDQLTAVSAGAKNYDGLDDFLSRMGRLLATIPDVLSKTYFKHEVPHFPSNDVHLS